MGVLSKKEIVTLVIREELLKEPLRSNLVRNIHSKIRDTQKSEITEVLKLYDDFVSSLRNN